MKIAIFGGSFNPIHNGHISMVKYLLENYNFDRILIVPIGIPSHKENRLASGKNRVEMCRLAFQNMTAVEITSLEVEEKKISYTIDTLMKIKELYPKSEIFEIIGEDSAYNFHLWKEYEKILQECQILVFRREIKGRESIGERKEIIKKNFEKFEILKAPYFPFSSTEIRRRLKVWNRDGEDKLLKEMLSDPVLDYIKVNKLYI